VYAVAHRAFDLGLVGLVLFVPALLFAPLAGIVADRYDRRAIVAVVAGVEIAGCVVLARLAERHDPGALVADLGLLFGLGVARAFEFPAAQALLPAIVRPEEFLRRSSVRSAIRQVLVIGGPALGGGLVALGAGAAYATAAVLFAAGAAVLPLVVLRERAVRAEAPTLRDALGGVRFVLSRPLIAGAISLDLFAVLFGGATALLPIYATQIFHVGAAGFGMLRSSPALGAFVMAVVLARRPLQRRAGPRLFAAVAVFGAATIAFGLSRSLWLAVAALALTGAADMISVIVRRGVVQLGTPNAVRGQVNAVQGVFVVASNELGAFESGTLAALVGPVASVVAGGVLTLAVAAAWYGLFPALRRADGLVPAEAFAEPTEAAALPL
jgi:hypothetical protein